MFDESPQLDEHLGHSALFVDREVSDTISWWMGDFVATSPPHARATGHRGSPKRLGCNKARPRPDTPRLLAA
jgi:hypothetical protein